MKIKRVMLVHSSGTYAIFAEEYPASARDIDILNTIYEVGKNVWIGNELYKVMRDYNGRIVYFKYKIYVTRH